MGFATGKYAKFISDRSGMAFPYKERVREWNGAIVHISEFEAKHPQLDPSTNLSDDIALKDAKPDRTEPSVIRLLEPNPFLSGGAGTNTITVSEKNHGRSTDDIVRFRKAIVFDGFSKTSLEKATGYTITVLNENSYTVTITGGDTATAGNTRGGGESATVGPVTLEG